MSEEPTRIHPPPDEPDVEANPSPASGSVLAAVLAKREQHVGDRTLDLDVPGYGGLLVLRMQPLPPGALSRITQKADRMRAGQKEFAVNADLLIAGCREVMARRSVEDELEDLVPGEQLRIDDELGRTLNMRNPSSARSVLLELFEKANDPTIAVGVAATEYAQWSSEADEDVGEALLGESPATRE